MNQSNIAALYAAINYPAQLELLASGRLVDGLPGNTLEWLVGRKVSASELTGPQGRTYGVNVKNMDNRADRGRNAFGERIDYELEAALPERVHAWAVRRMPSKVDHHAVRAAHQAVWSAMVMQYAHREGNEQSVLRLEFGAKADFEVLVRGVLAHTRKVAKRTKKVLAQLAAYHRAQELKQLRQGRWLGAEKALVTAARTDEPGVPFFGAVAHKADVARAYWAVPAGAGMDTHFPAGTGVALKQVTRSQKLVDGAVYVWAWRWGKGVGQSTTLIGRCDMRAKTRGHLPLRHEGAASVVPMCWLSWERPEIKVYRVTHYTTRAAQPVQMVAETQPVPHPVATRVRYAAVLAAA